MRKLLTIVLLFSAFILNAQTYALKGGLTLTDISSGSSGYIENARTGTFIGGVVDFTVSNTFHIQPEIILTTGGSKDLNANSLDVPVLVKFYATENVTLHAGPQFGFILNSDLPDSLAKTFNFGLALGGAYELDEGIYFEGRYNLGLSDIAESSVGGINTRGLQLGIGYRF